MTTDERKEVFHFKRFDIAQEQCAMKVGTDGVLLGAWVTPPLGLSSPRILDIGTGTGLIALMAAQRCDAQPTEYTIDAIEIDQTAALQAQQNFHQSPWNNHIITHACSLEEYSNSLIGQSVHYDLILSNPPFYNGTLKPKDPARATARHKDALPLNEITEFARRHLTTGGRLALIYPMDYDQEVMTASAIACLKPLRICNVLTKEGKPCKRRLAEFGLNADSCSTGTLFETLAIRDSQGEYTDEYKKLTYPFYTHLH